MGSVFKHLFGFGALAAVALPFVAACETNNQSLVVKGQIPPTIQDGFCKYIPTDQFLTGPTIDVAFADTYVGYFAVFSQFVPRKDDQVPRAESNTVSVTGAEVRVTDGLGGELGAFTTLVSTTVISPAAVSPVPVTLVPPSIAARLRNELKPREQRQLVIFFKLFGQTLGNKSIESGEYQFVITATRGGLVTFPADTDDTTVPGVDCNLATKDTAPDKRICDIGADFPLSCTLCRASLGASNPLCSPTP